MAKNIFSFTGNGVSSIVSWDEDYFEIVNNKKAMDESDLLLGLTKAGFFSSQEVKNALGYKRQNRYILDTRMGMSGCKDFSLYELRKGEILREDFTHKILRARIHLSMADKFNNGIHCPLVDFVTISFKEWGWANHYLNPEWIEKNIYEYLQEEQYSNIAHRAYVECTREQGLLDKWIEHLKEGCSWWYQVRVRPISTYEGDSECEGSLLDNTKEAPVPDFILTREVERVEDYCRFFRTTTWVKMFTIDDPDNADTSAWFVERNKFSLREDEGETGLEEMLYILNGCKQPSPEQAEVLKQKLYDHHSVGQFLFEDSEGNVSFKQNDGVQDEYRRRYLHPRRLGKRDVAEEAPAEA